MPGRTSRALSMCVGVRVGARARGLALRSMRSTRVSARESERAVMAVIPEPHALYVHVKDALKVRLLQLLDDATVPKLVLRDRRGPKLEPQQLRWRCVILEQHLWRGGRGWTRAAWLWCGLVAVQCCGPRLRFRKWGQLEALQEARGQGSMRHRRRAWRQPLSTSATISSCDSSAMPPSREPPM